MASRRLGRFLLLERVAQGGMGEVYRGVDSGLGGVERPVAIKLIRPELADSERHVESFLGEARVSFILSHPNVVQLFDAGKEGDEYYMAMEWIDGTDLAGVQHKLAVTRSLLPLALALQVGIEAARGLDYAHRMTDGAGRPLKLVHRDVSPSNILISYEGAVKISDFGIAKSLLRRRETQAGWVKGKVGYMAPEQARGEALDHRADVFSLGVVLYELTVGRNPFADGAQDPELLMRVQQGLIRPPRAFAPDLAPELEALLTRALANDPATRTPSAGQLRDELERFANAQTHRPSTSELSRFVRELMSTETVAEDGLPPTVVDRPAVPALGPTPTSPRPAEVSTQTEIRPKSGARRWLALLGVAAALGGGWWLWRAKPPDPPVAHAAIAPPEPPPPTPPPPPVAPPPVARVASRPRPTRLNVTSDIAANVFLDGKLLGEAPVRLGSVPPGHHVIRAVDVSQGGMRHLPVEREIDLRPGEQRQVDLAFK